MTLSPARTDVKARFAGRLGAFTLDVVFTLPPRGVTALVGPSGAGKTSVLRCLAGLSSLPGTLVVEGETWQDERRSLPPHRRAIGMVFQDASLLSHLSVTDNLRYGQRRTREPLATGFEEVVALLGLEALLGRSTTHLSGGERQRVALGRALLSQPRLLLMDEPLSSLDADSKAEILPYLESLHRTLAIPVLYVSHDADEVRRLADHLLVMRAGRVIDTATDVRAAADVQRAAAAQRLAGMEPASIGRLALAALLAGLDPA
jgi:molybdate transport system ATP-binding protein